ncbi:alpha-2,8-sialyltransferase 8F-like isoform X2 [Stegostoma tigrinum]|uniref:alpha-2,8-sialyltransferase 8F-like isoform X2 n=1 Tax=Stegostoma tigrinum TaxID=3053191 RepID=UPI00202B758B|nr:alpha-2,8-sialyltransferase 8F-like isoform X2 [Stegostoma tigrinum]
MVTQNKDCQFACCIRTIFLIDMSRFALRITCICVLCLFLYGILVNFIQLFDYRLQVRNTAERRINDSENVDDTGCDKCSHSQVTNFWEKNATDCAKIYKEIALSLFQRQTEEDVTNNITKLRHCQWHKQELAAEEFRSELKQCCNSADNFIVTQKNTPVGTELTYEGEPKRKIKITEQIFRLFPKNMSFSSVQYKQCAVVGNGGNLVNSSCGTEIDRADFVFRCNLPPVGGRFTQDVGLKTDLVTANPSIIAKSYAELHNRRKPFYTDTIVYNEALLLLPAFSYPPNTALSFRALYTLEDFQAKQKVVFFNPIYIQHLTKFWLSKGIQVKRLSTGLMIVSLALELCEEVYVYGFWPFAKSIEGKVMLHHYYDNQLPKPNVHSMPTEFLHLLQLHSKGIIKLQLAKC